MTFLLLTVVCALLCIRSVLCADLINGDDNNDYAKNTSINSDNKKLVNHSNTEINLKDNMKEKRSYHEETMDEEPRKKKEPDLMSRILPMMIIPFLLQTAIIPMMLTMLKFMLIKSALIGKMAILLGLLNMFRRTNDEGGVFTHNIFVEHPPMHEGLAAEHYGYSGGDEYGAYINRRKRNIR